MTIQPIRNARGVVKTNVEIVREAYEVLKELRDGTPGMSSKEKELAEEQFLKICNNDSDLAERVMNWCEQIVNSPDDESAQRMIEKTLKTPIINRR